MAENKCKLLSCGECCHDLEVDGTPQQAQWMQEAGGDIYDATRLLSEKEFRIGIRGVCPYFNGECGVYETAKQPEACRTGFKFDGRKCRELRGFKKRGW